MIVQLDKSSVGVDGCYHINELKLKLEAMIREYSILLQNLQLPTVCFSLFPSPSLSPPIDDHVVSCSWCDGLVAGSESRKD